MGSAGSTMTGCPCFPQGRGLVSSPGNISPRRPAGSKQGQLGCATAGGTHSVPRPAQCPSCRAPCSGQVTLRRPCAPPAGCPPWAVPHSWVLPGPGCSVAASAAAGPCPAALSARSLCSRFVSPCELDTGTEQGTQPRRQGRGHRHGVSVAGARFSVPCNIRLTAAPLVPRTPAPRDRLRLCRGVCPAWPRRYRRCGNSRGCSGRGCQS